MTLSAPAQKVRGALPGSLADLSDRTGYPTAAILAALQSLRAAGVIVYAKCGRRTLDGTEGVGAGWEPTRYEEVTR